MIYKELPHEIIAEISLALLERGVFGECRECHQGHMTIRSGVSVTLLYPYENESTQKCVVCVVTECDRCGHKEEYDIKSLGLDEKIMPLIGNEQQP